MVFTQNMRYADLLWMNKILHRMKTKQVSKPRSRMFFYASLHENSLIVAELNRKMRKKQQLALQQLANLVTGKWNKIYALDLSGALCRLKPFVTLSEAGRKWGSLELFKLGRSSSNAQSLFITKLADIADVSQWKKLSPDEVSGLLDDVLSKGGAAMLQAVAHTIEVGQGIRETLAI